MGLVLGLVLALLLLAVIIQHLLVAEAGGPPPLPPPPPVPRLAGLRPVLALVPPPGPRLVPPRASRLSLLDLVLATSPPAASVSLLAGRYYLCIDINSTMQLAKVKLVDKWTRLIQ